MDWSRSSTDQVELALDHFSGLAAAGLARVCELIGEVDRRQSWMADGARTLTDWVSARLRIRHETAAQLVGVTRRLTQLPAVSERFAAGGLSLDQVDAISRLATSDTEGEVLGAISGLSNAMLDRAARRRRGITAEQAATVAERRCLVRQWNLDQSELRFHGRLPGEAGRHFDTAIDTRIDEIPPNPETGLFDAYQTRAADALTELATTSSRDTGAMVRFNVFTDLETLTTHEKGTAELDNGALIATTTVQRLACDPVIRLIIRDGEQVVGIGRASRQIPGWLRDLVYQRDGYQCQFPGCTHTRWLQIHHITPWSQGGATNLDNLILLCGHHHRHLHQHHWQISGPPEHRIFRRPDQQPYPPPKPELHPRLIDLIQT